MSQKPFAAGPASLKKASKRGSFVGRDPKFARLLLLSAANWLYQWYQPEGTLTPEEIADRFAAILLSGIAVHKEGES